MIKGIALFLILINSLFALTLDSRKAQLIDLIDEELREVSRISAQVKNRDPEYLLRMAELYLERARIIKEQENDDYLQIPAEQRRNKRKSDYFKNSRDYFSKAQQMGSQILVRFKKYNKKADVYYILGQNAKEFLKNKSAKNYFKNSIKYARSQDLKKKSQIALAELYYNDNQFKSAKSLYESGLNGPKNKWWTKDSYSLAWSYWRTSQKSRAIDKMREVYRVSSDQRFVDMRSQVESDLAKMFAATGKSEEAKTFFTSIGKDFSKHFKSLGMQQIDRGQFSAGINTLMSARRYSDDDEEKTEIDLKLLSAYEKTLNFSSHLSLSKRLVARHQEKKLYQDQYDAMKYQLTKMGSVLQNRVAQGKYKTQKSKILAANQVGEYFDLISIFTGESGPEKYFIKGETFYAAGLYTSALPMYDQAYLLAKKSNDDKYQKLALKSMLATLGQKRLPSHLNEKYLIPTFNRYLEVDKKSKRAASIYEKMFNHHMDKNDLTSAEKTLFEYKENFPNNNSKQEAMLAKIMETYRKRKDYDNMGRWIGLINKGEFVVSKKYASQLSKVIRNQRFKAVESASKKGNKTFALKEYYAIYADPKNDEASKKNAAYNIMALYHEAQRPEEAFAWGQKALDLMGPSEVGRFSATFLTVTNEFFLRQKFNYASIMAESVFSKICRLKNNNKDTFFRNTFILYLSEGEVDKARNILDKGKRCSISQELVSASQFDLLDEYKKEKRWTSYRDLIDELAANKNNSARLIEHRYSLLNAYISAGRDAEAQDQRIRILNDYRVLKASKYKIPLSGLDIVASFKLTNLEREISKLDQYRLTFPEKVFNDSLKRKLKQLDQITSVALDVLKVQSGKGIVKSYRLLIESYQKVVTEITAFRPDGKGDDYLKSFQKSMYGLARPLSERSREFFEEAKREIQRAKILGDDNYWFFSDKAVPVKVQYFPSDQGILMDRGGTR